MIDFLIAIYSDEKAYLFTGLGLLSLAFFTSSGKISSKIQQFSYFSILLWILAIGYRVVVGDDISSLFL